VEAKVSQIGCAAYRTMRMNELDGGHRARTTTWPRRSPAVTVVGLRASDELPTPDWELEVGGWRAA